MVTTLTTVGYGDLKPQHDNTKIFTCFYVIFGIGFIGAALSIVAQYVMDKIDEKLDDGDETNDYIRDEALKDVSKCGIIMLFFILVGAIYFTIANGEQWKAHEAAGTSDHPNGSAFTNSFYMAVMTVTTVGYGDFSPTGEANRVFAIFWMLCGVLATGNTLGALINIFIQIRQEQKRQKKLAATPSIQELLAHAGT